jgi:hypothetical protein
MRTSAQKPKATQQTKSAKSTIPGRAQFGQSHEVNSILHLQRTIGNQAVQRMLQTNAEELEAGLASTVSPRFAHDFSEISVHSKSPVTIQTKLTVTTPGDIYEQEADHVSDQVMRMPEPQLQRACLCGGGCPKCQTEQPGWEHESLQTKRVQASDTGQIAAPPIVHEVLRSPGQPLDAATRAFMEPRFGYDFSRVRVHTGAVAEESALDVIAHAYTVGHDVVFGAGRFAPEAHAGRRLIAHELVHVVQQSDMGGIRVGQSDQTRGQSNFPVSPSFEPSFLKSGMALQRAPIKRPDIKPIPALAPLEVVVSEVAALILKNYSAQGIAAGPVCTGVLDEVTGNIYIGLNSGIPPKITDVVAQGISAQQGRVDRGGVIVVRTDPLAKEGGHSEPNAVNAAVSAREALLNGKVTEADLRTFKLHNIWLKGADRKFTAAPRCEHCARITRSISVTSSVFFAEGGVSGQIKPPPPGQRRIIPRVGPGGATGGVHGEITVTDKPLAPPTPAAPTKITAKTGGQTQTPAPEPTSSMDVHAGPPIPKPTSRAGFDPTTVAPAVNASANLLSIIFGPYLFPEAEENYKKRLQELQNKLQPTIEARINELLKTEIPRIAELGKRSNELFIIVKLAVWTQGSDVQGVPANLVNLLLEDMKLGTKNINEPKLSHSLADAARCSEIGHCKSYQIHSIPVPLAIQQEAVRRLQDVGAFDLKQFNYLADSLKASSDRRRLSGVLNMYKLVKDIGSLRGPAIQQLIPILRDETENVRAVAAVVLQSLDATEAIPFIRQALAETNDQDKKNIIQKSLDRLDRLQK